VRSLNVIARLKPGVSLEQAQGDMDRIANNLQAQNPDFYPESGGFRITVVPLLESTVGKIRPMLLLVLAVVGFVLLIACMNVANLLLARSYALQKGVAIRAALGASRARLIREFLTESVLLALAGGAAGLILAYWGIHLLVAVSPKETIPRLHEIGLDGTVLAFTFGVSLLTGIIFGTVPALQASKHDLNDVLKEGGRSSSGGGVRHLLPNSLVIAEVAVTIVLLTGAGLMIKSFWVLRNADPGFEPGNAMTMRTYVPQNSTYRDPAKQASFFEQCLDRIREIPGVESAGASFYLPLAGSSLSCSFIPDSSHFTPGESSPEADWRAVSPGFFESLNIPLIQGRDFTKFDRPGTPLAVVIDRSLADQYWPNEDPLGKRLKLTLPMVRDQWLTVVGVVGHVWHSKMNSVVRPEVYTSFIQTPMAAMSFVVRSSSKDNQLTAAVTREIHEVESLVPVYEVKSMRKIVSDSLGDSRLLMLLLSIFAGVALVLASVGIYGVMSYSVTQRTHEIGIRMAMGARAVDVLKLIFRKGLALTLVGAFIGLAASYALSAYLTSLLYGISATDPLVFILTPVVLVLVAVFACFVPARRATQVDPVIALRFE
jgi:putative ABC transport system permease protein